jgi:heme-degrading monooxygenase HmoA
MIIRVFETRVRDGRDEEYVQFWRDVELPLLRSLPGLLDVSLGVPIDGDDDRFLMVTVWRDVEALRGFTGQRWREVRVLPEEQGLLLEPAARHYRVLEMDEP